MARINALLAHLNLGPLSEHTVRKLAHFAEFTLEGFLLMLSACVCIPRILCGISAGRCWAV